MASGLPPLNRRKWVEQHKDVERQVVADEPRESEFGRYDQAGRSPYRQNIREVKAQHTEENIGHRIEDAVAVIIVCGGLAVAVDDEWGILQNFP